MNYKIVSKDTNLLEKSHNIFNILGYKEAIHIQDVDFWLIDAKSMDNSSITSYKNRKENTFLLFVINSSEEVALCLQNGFTNYMNINFSKKELLAWCKFCIETQKDKTTYFKNNYSFNIQTSELFKNQELIELTKKESQLIVELLKGEFVSTLQLANNLTISSKTSVRTIVNRIRNKTDINFLEQKRGYGYKLQIEKQKSKKNMNFNSYIKEIKEQNYLMQQIIDSSPIYIVTFIHKQLYCINESFREYLGREIVKELWDETKGDFFQLIEKVNKIEIFKKGSHKVELYKINENLHTKFEVETFYFENLDKHLLVFKHQS